MTRLFIGIMMFFILVGGFSSCGPRDRATEAPRGLVVVTTLFPLYDFAKQVGGDKARVILLLPPGVEAHSFEPKPADMIHINSAGLFLYTGRYMEPWVEPMLKSLDNKGLTIVEVSDGIALRKNTGEGEKADRHASDDQEEGHHHGGYDPHIWLDFANAGKMIDNIVAGFTKADPRNRELYIRNGSAYKNRLMKLDEEFRDGLSGCRTRVLIHGGHFAFGYLAARYNLQYVSAYEGSPNAEPTPGRIIQLEKLIGEKGAKHVFYEELISPRVADILARETGVTLLKLHGAHNISRDDFTRGITFIELMEENLRSLKVGLACRQ